MHIATHGPSPGARVEARIPPRLARTFRVVAVVAPLAVCFAMGWPVCPFAVVTGHPCPGCGMTRAAAALAAGDLAAATAANPTALVTVPLSAALVAFFVGSYLYDGRLRANARIPRALAIATIATLTVVAFARALGAFGGPVPV